MKRSQIKRKTPLKRGGKLKPVSAKRKKDSEKYAFLRQEFLRDNPLCRATLIIWPERSVRVAPWATEIHHANGRTGKNYLDTRTWVPVCREAHSWIEANRQEAERLGLTMPTK